MAKKSKGKLNLLTFFYGFGAAVVLVGSMFKFVDWDFANELFIAGLSIEVLVFLVSAFERTEDDKEYEWERVFPQLSQETEDKADIAHYNSAMNQFGSTLNILSEQINGLNNAIGNIKEEMTQNATASREMHEKMQGFNKQLGEYNEHMEKINSRYKDFLSGAK